AVERRAPDRRRDQRRARRPARRSQRGGAQARPPREVSVRERRARRDVSRIADASGSLQTRRPGGPMAEPSAPILFVDDDDDIREAIAEGLTDNGFDVLTAANGLDAMRVLRNTHPSVILLDLMMPVMDGYEFLEERRVDPALAAIPVAVIT